MGVEIDNKVVSMSFDNKDFEARAKESMSTLEKLKEKLKFTGATKGLNEVNDAAKKVNLNPLSKSLDEVKVKFSALQVAGVTALANITTTAMQTGKRVTEALTIEPVKMGLQEYETQINAIQTILANTEHQGTTLGQVNAALDELNKYADQTIYNFTEMKCLPGILSFPVLIAIIPPPGCRRQYPSGVFSEVFPFSPCSLSSLFRRCLSHIPGIFSPRGLIAPFSYAIIYLIGL